MDLKSPKSEYGYSEDLKPANQDLPTRLKLTVNEFMDWYQVFVWPSPDLFRLLHQPWEKIQTGSS